MDEMLTCACILDLIFFRLEITLKMTVHFLLFPALFFQLAAIQRCVSYIFKPVIIIVLIVLFFGSCR